MTGHLGDVAVFSAQPDTIIHYNEEMLMQDDFQHRFECYPDPRRCCLSKALLSAKLHFGAGVGAYTSRAKAWKWFTPTEHAPALILLHPFPIPFAGAVGLAVRWTITGV